jgi:hypothetical protein
MFITLRERYSLKRNLSTRLDSLLMIQWCHFRRNTQFICPISISCFWIYDNMEMVSNHVLLPYKFNEYVIELLIIKIGKLFTFAGANQLMRCHTSFSMFVVDYLDEERSN